jgi:uncharacterized linocin/CFP29 family protein
MGNGTYDLKWGHDLAARITPQTKTEIGRLRKSPPLIPIVPGSSQYEDVVPDYTVTLGPPLSIKPSRKLALVKISSEFLLAQQQFSDEALAARLALHPASDLAYAEDAILLHGARASGVLKKLNICDEDATLDEQVGLFRSDPKPLPKDKSIMSSIREGLEYLQTQQQHGPYCVVVSPDLHREAITPSGTGTTPQIAPVLPELRESGFRFSEAAAPRTGVIFSLGGGAIDLCVTFDSHIECRKVEGDATFVVVEQFRLRINDARAVVTLS